MKKKININLWLITVILTWAFASCNEEALIDKYEVQAPVLTDFSPRSGEIGTEITITGSNLQRVNEVSIGGGPAEIKYRINGEEMVVRIISSSRSGKITVSNIKGTSESTDEFKISYLTPSVDSYPTDGTVHEELVLTGENLHVIESVLVENEKATIISQRKNELVFRVPFIDSEEAQSLAITYFDGQKEISIGPDGKTFTVLKEAPIIYSVPTSLTKYEPVTIEGDKLSLIDAIYINDIKVIFKYRNENQITFDMPANYFDGNMTGVLTATYYGIRKIILEENFQVYSDPNEPRYYTHKNVLLSARVAYGGTENAFFDAESGMVFSSCDAFDNRLDIDFYAYDQSGFVQLYGPHQGGNTVKNYKCDGKTIDGQDGSWNDFYGNGGIETKFRVLSKDSINHLPVIQAFEAGTIVFLNDELFEGIPLPGTSAPRIYKSANDNGYSAKEHFSIDQQALGWVKNYTTGKNGIIKFTSIPQDAVNGRIPDITFDILWEK